MRFSNFNIAVSSFAALAGVALAAYQVFAPQPEHITPTPETTASAGALIETASIELAHGASFTSALKDGSDQRYQFGQLFDANPETYLTLAQSDSELNVLVTFGNPGTENVTALVYTPPAGVSPDKLASIADVAILPDGQMQSSGLPIYSFSLQRSPGSQTFAIPGRAVGKALWLRIAGEPGAGPVAVGDFRILKEAVAP
jgi:hypothetical protein